MMDFLLLIIFLCFIASPFVGLAWVLRCREPGCTFFKCNLRSR